MTKKFDKTIYVKIEEDDEEPYYIVSENVDTLVETGETLKLGVYQLVEIVDATGSVTFSKRCPWGEGMPDPDIEPEKPCPVCGDLGTIDTTPSKCIERRWRNKNES